MKSQTIRNNPRARNLATALCALTLGIPAAVAILPFAYTFTIPIAIVVPFFTMSYLESMLFNSLET